MAIFAISFRIQSGPNYSARWQSVFEAIKKEATGSTWEETTSFFVIGSQKSAKALSDAIYYGSDLLDNRDILVVINLSIREHHARGALEYPTMLERLLNGR